LSIAFSNFEFLLPSIGIPVGDDARHKATIVTLCTGGIYSGFGYFPMRLMGYEKVKNYDGSWWAWARRADLPVKR
jgi:3-mercaptopyruvate sulfurtransferase SseA